MLAGCLHLAVLLAVTPASATDTVIINGTGCQVTEEDAVGIFLTHDLYLRIDYPNTHWRFGLRNMGLKGTQALDVSIQGAQYNSPQYIIKRAGLAEMFVPYDDRSHTYYDMSFGDDRMDQMDPQDLPSQNGALVYFRSQHRQPLSTCAIPCLRLPWNAATREWVSCAKSRAITCVGVSRRSWCGRFSTPTTTTTLSSTPSMRTAALPSAAAQPATTFPATPPSPMFITDFGG